MEQTPLTTDQACIMLGITRQTLHELRKRGEFPNAFQISTHWRYPLSDIEQFKARQSTTPDDATVTSDESGTSGA